MSLLKMDDDLLAFDIQIADGQSFRNVLSTVKMESDIVAMVLSQSAISISFINSSKCAQHTIEIEPLEIVKYYYNVKDDKQKLLPSYHIPFDVKTLYTTVRSVAKQDGIRLMGINGHQKITVQLMPGGVVETRSPEYAYVDILNNEQVKCVAPEYSAIPNLSISVTDFAILCNKANASSCSHLAIIGTGNSLVFKGILPHKEVAFAKTYPFVEASTSSISSIISLGKHNQSSDYICAVEIPLSTVKALTKFNNICSKNSRLKIYLIENGPVKIESPIGSGASYGKYTMHIQSLD